MTEMSENVFILRHWFVKKSNFVFEDKLFLLIQNTQNYIEKFSLLNELLPLANLNDSIIHVIYIIHKYNYIFVASKMKRNVKNESGSFHVSWNIFDIRIYFIFWCTQKKTSLRVHSKLSRLTDWIARCIFQAIMQTFLLLTEKMVWSSTYPNTSIKLSRQVKHPCLAVTRVLK